MEDKQENQQLDISLEPRALDLQKQTSSVLFEMQKNEEEEENKQLKSITNEQTTQQKLIITSSQLTSLQLLDNSPEKSDQNSQQSQQFDINSLQAQQQNQKEEGTRQQKDKQKDPSQTKEDPLLFTAFEIQSFNYEESPIKYTKNNEKTKLNNKRKILPLNPLKDQKQLQRNNVSQLNLISTEENQYFRFQKNQLQNTIVPTQNQPEETKTITSNNNPQIQQNDLNTNQDSESQVEAKKQHNSKKKKALLIIITILISILAISIPLSILLSQKKPTKPSSINFFDPQYKINHTLAFHAQSIIHQITTQKDGQASVKVNTIDYLIKVLCLNKTLEDQTSAYEIGKENSTQIKPGVKDFLNVNQRILQQTNNTLPNSTDNGNSNGNGGYFNTPLLNVKEDELSNFPQDFPFPKEIYEISRAEVVMFNVTNSGEIIDIILPINLDQSFLYSIPTILNTISPSLLKEHYNIIEDNSGKKRILQEGTKVKGKNIEGEYNMDKMDKYDTEEGGAKLVTAYSQSSNNNYTQTTSSVSQTTYNKDGYLTQAEVNAEQKIGDSTKQDDIFNSIDLKQTFRVNFLKEEIISNEEYLNVSNVYGLMGKIQMNWDIFYKVLEKLRESQLVSSHLTKEEEQEPPLVHRHQNVDFKNPSTRLLADNDSLVDDLQVELISKSVLSMPIKSFIAFKCQKPSGGGDQDTCKSQIFLSFLSLNIPVSPVKEASRLHSVNYNANLLKYSRDRKGAQRSKQIFYLIHSLYQFLNQKEYGFLKDLMTNLVQDVQQNILSEVKGQVDRINSIVPNIQKQIEQEILNIQEIINAQRDQINSTAQIEIQNLVNQIQQTKDKLLNEAINKLTQPILDQIQIKVSGLVDQVLDYFNSQISFIEDEKNVITDEIKTKINQIIKKSLTNILTKPITQLTEKLQESIANTNNLIQSNVQKIQQDIDKKLLDIDQKVKQLEIIAVDASEELLDQLKEKQEFYEELLEDYLYQLSPEILISSIEDKLELLKFSIQEDVPNRVKNISAIFTNLIHSMTTKLRSTLTKLKGKAKDISQDILMTIQQSIDSVFNKLDGFKDVLEDQINFFYKLLQSNFDSQDIIPSIKKQLGKLGSMLDDNPNDVPVPSLKNRNLILGNLFDMSILSFATEIKDFATSGIQKIKDTANTVKNLKNTFIDFSQQLNQIFIVPFDVSDYFKLDLKFEDELEEFINSEELLSIFQDTINNIKQEFTQFIKSEIIETVQHSGINLIKEEFEKIGEKIVKKIIDNSLSKLFDSDKLFELAITKISSLFQVNKFLPLYKKSIRLPDKPQPYFIPTPIGIPVQLSYAFVFEVDISMFLGIQGLSVSAGFKLSADAYFEASAALTVLIAEIGVVGRGSLIKADLIAQLNMAVYPKGLFKVKANFSAFNLYAAAYISYITFDIKLQCYKVFRRRLFWKKLFNGIFDILTYPIKIITTALDIAKKLIKNGEVCIPIPVIQMSEKIPILPPLTFNGPKFEKDLFYVKLG